MDTSKFIVLFVLLVCSYTCLVDSSLRVRSRPASFRRFECRDSLPRKPEDLPDTVITGRVLQVLIDTPSSSSSQIGTATTSTENVQNGPYKASILVQRVIKPKQQKQQQQQQQKPIQNSGLTEGSIIIVTNFNESTSQEQVHSSTSTSTPTSTSQWCQNNVRPNDTWIFLLNNVGDSNKLQYTLNNTLLAPSLSNLDRINSIVDDENTSFKRRQPVVETPCERHYCPFNADCIEPEGPGLSPRCECPTECGLEAGTQSVCGTDLKTYASECHLRMESCKNKQSNFVFKLSPCLVSNRS